jgi:putative endonuclease
MAGTSDGYTSKRLPVELVFAYEMPTIFEAFLRERQIKGWARRKKEALIKGGIDKRRVG